MKVAQVRQLFLDYFKNNSHSIVTSSPLVPGNDPTLLFTNAGMVQFKDVFLGQEKRPYTRATSSQRCVRAGGKHNDLDNVGYTARHHTFFEMLGNFSFGDYFKREAIQFAWQFLTKDLKLPKEKLWVTVYTDDDEAADIWLKEVGVSEERFSRCGEKDNFWSMGDTGPCGPCSEIFYDHGEDVPGGPPGSADEDGDRYIEIWNLVFMQYNRDAEGELTPLPKPSVDTGMGLERIAAVIQGVHNNYDIDLFQSLIKAIIELSQTKDKDNPSLKVIADHIRAISFLIVDGVMPGNEGRGYVLRRIIRRAARHGHKLGLDEPFLHQLVKALALEMGEAYPELNEMRAEIEEIILKEEEQFLKTLSVGLKILEEDLKENKGGMIKAEIAFKLYDTYGFPLDLTQDIARERALSVDAEGFDRLMEAQKDKGRAHSTFKAKGDKAINLGINSEFCGYDALAAKGKVMALLDTENQQVDKLEVGDELVGMVLDITPFYAESGGQIGDAGEIRADHLAFDVVDTQKLHQAIVHFGYVRSGAVAIDDTVTAEVDAIRREAIVLNHSATHLLHAALRQVLGTHVQQKGSLVAFDKARFDFSHFKPVTIEEIVEIEHLINQQIRGNHLAETVLMDFEEAKQSGAIALFGEKYEDKVRVLSLGEFSKELCGGTHVARTGDIGFCKIIAETGTAAGIRRIEMVTGTMAHQYVLKTEAILKDICDGLHAKADNVVSKLDGLLKENKALVKEGDSLKAKLANQSGNTLLEKTVKVGDYSLLLARLDNYAPRDLRTTLDKIKDKMQKGVVVLVAVNGDKMNVIGGLTKDSLNSGLSAKTLVQAVCGKGGGRDDMAQGGGPLVDDLEARFETVKTMVNDAVNT